MTSSINGVNSTLESLAIKSDETKKSNQDLGQEEFLELMVAQLNNQDPTKPMENAEFLGQLAQFGTVNGITELQTSVNSLATSLQSNQALQASTMVGRTVSVPTSSINLTAGEAVKGAVSLSANSSQVTLNVKDESGQTVKELSLGAQSAGDVNFTWDGTDDSGSALPDGVYTFIAEANIDGDQIAMGTQMQARVNSVTLSGTNGPVLNLAGIGAVSISDVKEIQ